jgi:hypothetical protein
VSLEIRAAGLGNVLGRLSTALGARLEAEAGVAGQRITVYAPRTSLYGFQQAAASLLHTRWKRLGKEGEARYQLLDNRELEDGAEQLRQQRRALFVARLLQTADTFRRRKQAGEAQSLRADVARRMPFLPAASLEQITPDLLRQALFLLPLRPGLREALVLTGSAWSPFHDLAPGSQQMLSDFAIRRFQAERGAEETGDAPGRLSPEERASLALRSPQARLEYRLLYGDRWTDTLALARVGAGDDWAVAALPSALYPLPDFASLYPEAWERPVARELYSPLKVEIDTGAQTWEQALTLIARTAKINVLSDSFPRPQVFQPPGKSPVIAGKTLGETLDQAAEYYGLVWWKDGDWYLFRSRLWAEEQRVAVPDGVVRSLSAGVAKSGRLSPADFSALTGLTDEQLLTLHLGGSAAGKRSAPVESFDYNEIQLVRAGLLLLGELGSPGPDARPGPEPDPWALARGEGLPFRRMSPAQQFIFSTVASDRGVPLDPYEQGRWALRVSDRFRRERLPTGWAEGGALEMVWDFGQGRVRRTELALRLPALEPPGPKDAQEKRKGAATTPSRR